MHDLDMYNIITTDSRDLPPFVKQIQWNQFYSLNKL